MAITALVVQPSLAQSQAETEEALVIEIKQLIQQAAQYQQQGKPLQAIEIWQQLLAFAQQFKVRQLEAAMLYSIGGVYDSIGQPQKALNYYNQALPIAGSQ
ncbi:tetratricopeptide repeat protein [Oscillatoria laete-virens NRMC-F 0139]|nr:tetratricopeptide repeat protein [Oscillatoria laete-virens]MDL5055193.1 tetratricopeptide repeat protein [Oscillatoria laete-virens NRMC-F 0139]